MRYFYVFVFSLFIINTSASGQSTSGVANFVNGCGAPYKVRSLESFTRAPRPKDTLYIVDGVLVEAAQGKRLLDRNDIESVSILKSTGVYIGCRGGMNEVIVITTKPKSFSAVDAEDNKPLPGATFTFVDIDGGDSMRYVADELGIVRVNKLDTGRMYQVLISSVGYKDADAIYFNENERSVNSYRLTRDVKENTEVIVAAGHWKRGCGWRSSYTKVSRVAVPDTVADFRLLAYPNPVNKGSVVRLDLESVGEDLLQIRIVSASGAVLNTMTYRPIRGMINRIGLPIPDQLAAGVYFLQVIAPQGRLMKQAKLVVL